MLVDTSETRSDLLSIPLVGGGSTQVLGALFDFQLLADLSADLFALLIQKLLHTGVGEIWILVQTKLLQNRQPTWVALNGYTKSKNGIVRAEKARQILENDDTDGKGSRAARKQVLKILQNKQRTFQVKHEY